ncbi:gamma-glutamyl-gamma-aminobutyrate hydrolase family protein [Maridesulfovibrio sp.]|uniref:type 1 glutamine amidotransferase n=1 Tax=Maridesulfovibrio sp. TaxID=2795000 RepID=UPI0029F59026|nr:gamma-glutamyl-gamma-aminobutyrate hydrolase family protein [Maridesulfovibrio sp.]
MQKPLVLVLNILFETPLRNSFDNRMAEVFGPVALEYDTAYLEDLENIADTDKYTHLLISGSTASATEEKDWYPALDSIIHRFRSEKKAILGICFGHQFLIRHILGKDHVRKSATPEIGWTKIKLSETPAFDAVGSIKSAVFHYDEVFDLDSRFEITASSDRCKIHGFKMKEEKIWGIQFHPDFMYEDVHEFSEDIRKNDPQFEEIHCQTETSATEFKKNDYILKKWIEVS